MRVASVYAFGKEPEGQAVDKLIASAKPKGFLDDRENHRIFGFNNPSPSPGSPNYGYEIWITVKPDVEPEGEVRFKEFNGGLYAVTHCEVIDGNYELIGATWKKLITWREDSKYDCGYYQWLEETIRMESVPPGDLVLYLHLPISA